MYKWNIEEMNVQIRRLTKLYEELEESQKFLSTLRQEVQESWQSMTGDYYSDKLEVDMKQYNNILSEMQLRITQLNKVANQSYAECEEMIRKTVSAINIPAV